MTTNVRSLDETIHLTTVWLKEIADEMGIEDREAAYRALRSTLHTLRDRMVPEEALHLASQLPALVRGVYYEGYRLADRPHRARSRDEFFAGIEETFQDDAETEALEAARAAVAVLRRHIAEGQFEQAMEMIPLELREELVEERV